MKKYFWLIFAIFSLGFSGYVWFSNGAEYGIVPFCAGFLVGMILLEFYRIACRDLIDAQRDYIEILKEALEYWRG